MITMGRSLTIQESQRVICFLHGKSLWLLLQILLDPEAMRTMSPWESNGPPKRVSEWILGCVGFFHLGSKSISPLWTRWMRSIEPWEKGISVELSETPWNLHPWNTMGKVRKICICIDLWMHRGVIFSKKAIRHPKTACYNMWVTTKFGQIPL